MNSKKCTICKVVKPIDLFYLSKGNISSCCKKCFLSVYRKRKILEEVVCLKGEVFNPIKENEKSYQISSFGRVKSLNYNHTNQPKILKNNLQNTGYLAVSLNFNGKVKTISVHRLVAEAFIPNPDNKPFVNHINGIKTDNRAENLEWCTASENTNHGIKIGLINDIRGQKNIFSVLSESDVLEIRKRYSENKESYKEIAKKYNVTPENISMIINKKTWKHLE